MTGRRSEVGTLIGVGVGPGDPDLLTIKGLRAIRRAEVVIAPVRRAGGASLAARIVQPWLDLDRQELVTLPFPEPPTSDGWREACTPIADMLRIGRKAVLLVEGDPSLFSTIGHVVPAIADLVPDARMEIIPGVTSATASAAAAGLMLAEYAERVVFVPAVAGREGIEDALCGTDTVVILKVGSVLGQVISLLEDVGRLDDAVYVRRCGLPDQAIVRDLRRLRHDPPSDYFALLIVGGRKI